MNKSDQIRLKIILGFIAIGVTFIVVIQLFFIYKAIQ